VRRLALLVLALGLCALSTDIDAQTRRGTPARRPATPALKSEPATLKCPALLGRGVRTRVEFCDVLISRQPADGVLITIPAHDGAAFVSFSLHNRHTYSEEEVRAQRAYAKYTAVVGLLTMESELIERAAVQSEFFSERDLFDRVEGGAGPRGLKAVAPIGAEQVRIEIDAATTQVSLLGEKLVVVRRDQTATYTVVGTPIATVSNVKVDYRPRRTRRR
jgi:hypothetical protein